MEFSQKYEQRKEEIEAKETLETYAALGVARENLDRDGQLYNSYDGTEKGNTLDGSRMQSDRPSFIRMKPDTYGLEEKWNTNRNPSQKLVDQDLVVNNDRTMKSELDAVEKEVKRNNLIDIFLRGTAVDQYIIENMYGKDKYINAHNPNHTLQDGSLIDMLNLDETFTHQMQLLHRKTFYGIVEPSENQKRKLTFFETYIALIKGYCALMILVLPKSFLDGGYVFSPICLAISAGVQMIAGLKLVRCGQSLGISSYGLITVRILGPKAKIALDCMIAWTQFSFTLSFMSFITTAWKSLAFSTFGLEIDIWVIAWIVIFILTLLSWIRDISKFSPTMMIGNLCILSTVLVVMTVDTGKLSKEGFGPGLGAWNNQYWAMVGFSCYAFEGIGVVMPIMNACECPEKFDRIYFYAMLTLTVVYIVFSDYTYLTFGTNTKHTFITEDLDQKSYVVIVLQAIYSLNLICSYPIFIFPANQILEAALFKGIDRKAKVTQDRELVQKYNKIKFYISNFTRFFMVALAMVIALVLHDKLNKFLSVLGALLCAPLAIMLPAMLHLKHLAETQREKIIDLVLIVLSLIVMVFSTSEVLSTW